MMQELISKSQSLMDGFFYLSCALGLIVVMEHIFFKTKKLHKPIVYFLIISFMFLITIDLINQYNFKKKFDEYSQYKNLKIENFNVKIYKQDSDVLENKIIYRCNDKTSIDVCVTAIKENLKKDLENGIIK